MTDTEPQINHAALDAVCEGKDITFRTGCERIIGKYLAIVHECEDERDTPLKAFTDEFARQVERRYPVTEGVQLGWESSPGPGAENSDNVSPSSRQPTGCLNKKYYIGRDPASFGNVYCGDQLVISNQGGGISDALLQMVDAANAGIRKVIEQYEVAKTKEQPVQEGIDILAGARACARWRNGKKVAFQILMRFHYLSAGHILTKPKRVSVRPYATAYPSGNWILRKMPDLWPTIS